MKLNTINPYNQEKIADYSVFSDKQVSEVLDLAQATFASYRNFSIKDRSKLLLEVAAILENQKSKFGHQISIEMGKPVSEAQGEVEKCAWVCRYYAENSEAFLQSKEIETDAQKSFVSYEPLGVILAVMPWNFPFWQVFRFLCPSLMAGNVAVLKHAPNTFGCALLIEEVLREAGFPNGVLQNLIVEVDQLEDIISDNRVKAATLTGSGRAGSSLASLAGKALKKTVLELGGSNAFIILEDADIEQALNIGFSARMKNNGQSCIAAKRFLVHENIQREFIDKFVAKCKEVRLGDPLSDEVDMGPLARLDLAENLERQVKESLRKGATLVTGGTRTDAFYEPTVLTNVGEGMPAFDEELFGPVAAFTTIRDLDHAIYLSNRSKFGLGVSVFTKNTKKVLSEISRFDDGAVFINEMVKSDPRLPFGGTKASGYGRELSREGLQEFLNIKTVYVA